MLKFLKIASICLCLYLIFWPFPLIVLPQALADAYAQVVIFSFGGGISGGSSKFAIMPLLWFYFTLPLGVFLSFIVGLLMYFTRNK